MEVVAHNQTPANKPTCSSISTHTGPDDSSQQTKPKGRGPVSRPWTPWLAPAWVRGKNPNPPAPEVWDKASPSVASGPVCYRCQEPGHRIRDCPQMAVDAVSQSWAPGEGWEGPFVIREQVGEVSIYALVNSNPCAQTLIRQLRVQLTWHVTISCIHGDTWAYPHANWTKGETQPGRNNWRNLPVAIWKGEGLDSLVNSSLKHSYREMCIQSGGRDY